MSRTGIPSKNLSEAAMKAKWEKSIRLQEMFLQTQVIHAAVAFDQRTGMTYFTQPANPLLDFALPRFIWGEVELEGGIWVPFPPPWNEDAADPRTYGWPIYVTGKPPLPYPSLVARNEYAQNQLPFDWKTLDPALIGTVIPGTWPQVIKTRWNASRKRLERVEGE